MFLFIILTGQTVEIVSPRPPISFPVGTNITFQCEATGSRSALWEVNMTQLSSRTQSAFAARGIITEQEPMLPAIGDISYTLYALASFENNRTVIRCQASTSVTAPLVSSNNVTLLVFGECFLCLNQTLPATQFLHGKI